MFVKILCCKNILVFFILKENLIDVSWNFLFLIVLMCFFEVKKKYLGFYLNKVNIFF